VSADGRWLASRDDLATLMMVRPPGARDEANLSWLDASQPRTLSSDGRLLLFTEYSGAVGNKYGVCLRKTDGSPVVRLGEGYALDLSAYRDACFGRECQIARSARLVHIRKPEGS
jgi:hypothetical protein